MKTSEIVVRKPTVADSEALEEVFRESWQLAYAGIIPHLSLETMIRQRSAGWWRRAVNRGDRTLVLELAGTIGGYVNFGRNRWPLPQQGEIYELYMAPAYQGVGLGEHLFEAARASLDNARFSGLLVWALAGNEAACTFYRRRGGRLVARTEERFGKVALPKLGFGWERLQQINPRAILVHVGDKKKPDAFGRAEVSMRELRELSRTAGVEVVDTVIQIRDHVDPKLVLGKGKLDTVILQAIDADADVLIFDRELTPAQSSAIAKVSDLKVLDRTQLILDIFAQRAESSDGKLQVELAQLKYNMPRLGLKDDALSRLTGGIGGRGPGETKLEIGRRRAKERVSHLESQLRKLARQREQRRSKRSRHAVPTVAIVGYTNAGKSTLLEALTGASVLTEDKLFATLDTRSRTLRVGWAGYGDREVVVTDTVGFIRSLPKDLFTAFRATFEEAADADLLLQVVDANDATKDEHIETTNALLTELGLDSIPKLVVMNKVDCLEPFAQKLLERTYSEALFVSAIDRATTRPLISAIGEALAKRWADSRRPPEVSYVSDAEAELTEAHSPAP